MERSDSDLQFKLIMLCAIMQFTVWQITRVFIAIHM